MEGWNSWIGELQACGHMHYATSGNSNGFLGTPLWNTVAPSPPGIQCLLAKIVAVGAIDDELYEDKMV
jgi:hypothetical protein